MDAPVAVPAEISLHGNGLLETVATIRESLCISVVLFLRAQTRAPIDTHKFYLLHPASVAVNKLSLFVF